MATGITIERTYNGVPTFAHIDLQKYGDELSDFFKSKKVDLGKTMIASPPKGYLTHEQFVAKCDAEIDELCKQNGILQ
ncbi:hypothetical protein FACS189415_4170 [Bacteroidia bacterium]|nr:hypothetical protein FACS189426_24330 [Bacteroidia bacterium]GHT85865.1 hypothetical protein FACS18947_5140 [Bacteroidia bacterium]GHU82909.1 hypothetical protein FACS189415_4170 [Bacteroidia bacterium]